MPGLPAAVPRFERAVAYGSYDAGLRDLIHVLRFQQVRPAAAVLGRVLAETLAKLEQTMPGGTIAVVRVPLHNRKASSAWIQSGGDDRAAFKRLSLKRFVPDEAI